MLTIQQITEKLTAMHGVVQSVADADDRQAIVNAMWALLPAISSGTAPLPPLPTPTPTPTPTPATKTPLYPSSVVGTDFDFITAADPSAFVALSYVGAMQFEMPDKRGGPLFQQAYVFNATFSGGNGRSGTGIKIACSNLFGSQAAAQTDAMRYTSRLGKLPDLYRRNINHIVVHTGGVNPAGTTAFAEDQGHFFCIYSENATVRIGTHDLEETFFHEASHASIQVDHINSAQWLAAVAADNAFITAYASTDPQEDFAESALFAYTMKYHPERFPEPDRTNIKNQIPNRIAFFATIF